MAVTLERLTGLRTHAGIPAGDLIGRLVRVRPFYCVPDSGHSLKNTRSPWTFEAYVTDESVNGMVRVRYEWQTSSAPWAMEGAFYPSELHAAFCCSCSACGARGGAGFSHHDGA